MDPRSAYRESAIRGASGVQLVVFLYEQLIQDLRRAAVAMQKGDIELRTKLINHAFDVIGHLQGTLDRKQGGQVSRSLDLFYCRLRARLTEAHVQISKEVLEEQISELLSLREAWIRVNLATQRGHLPSANAPTGEGMLTPQPSTITDWKY